MGFGGVTFRRYSHGVGSFGFGAVGFGVIRGSSAPANSKPMTIVSRDVQLSGLKV